MSLVLSGEELKLIQTALITEAMTTHTRGDEEKCRSLRRKIAAHVKDECPITVRSPASVSGPIGT